MLYNDNASSVPEEKLVICRTSVNAGRQILRARLPGQSILFGTGLPISVDGASSKSRSDSTFARSAMGAGVNLAELCCWEGINLPQDQALPKKLFIVDNG